jgi:hypothetical protein
MRIARATAALMAIAALAATALMPVGWEPLLAAGVAAMLGAFAVFGAN